MRSKLGELAERHQLCHGLLGIEKIDKRGCFGLQIKKCVGACAGQEDPKLHDDRLLAGLVEVKVHIWPYDGPVELVEHRGDWTQLHRIEQWRYLGTRCSRQDRFTACEEKGFELDTYKILIRPVMFILDKSLIKCISSA